MSKRNKDRERLETTLKWQDRTYRTEGGLRRFLMTLTPAQLEEAEVMVDDDRYVVFYPVTARVPQVSGYHYDIDTQSGDQSPTRKEEAALLPSPAAIPILSESEAVAGAGTRAEEVKFLETLLAGIRL